MVRTEKQVPYYYRSATQLLYAIALETGLKALWEVDNGRQAVYTHDLSEIFAKLHPDRREKHRRWYDLIADHAGSSVSLDAVLKANTDMVKDFKYGDYDGETASVVGGEVVSGIVVGGDGALISYGQFVIDDLELTIFEHTRFADRDPLY